MKKVALVLHDYKLSGANKSLLDWVEKSKEFEYIFVLPRFYKPIVDIILQKGFTYIVAPYAISFKPLSDMTIKERVNVTLKHMYQLVINPIIRLKLYYVFKKKKIDIIHSNSLAVLIGAEVANMLRVPHVWHVREFMEEDHKITHFNQKHFKKLKAQSNAIFISDVIEKKFKKDFKKTIIIYNRVFYDDTYIHKKKKDNQKFSIIIVGSLTDNKGQFEAIHAVEKINEKRNDIELYICGSGKNEAKIRKYLEENKINNIHLTGHVDNLLDIRKNMDIALMCSSNEALGRVTIEAMYYENCLIGASAGCTPYIVEDKVTGILYPLGRTDLLAEEIIKIIDDEENRKCIVANAKEYAINKFSKSISRKVERYYQEIIR